MLSKVALLQVVHKIVEWRDDGIREKVPPSNMPRCIEFGVERYGDKHEDKSGCNHDEKREWSGDELVSSCSVNV